MVPVVPPSIQVIEIVKALGLDPSRVTRLVITIDASDVAVMTSTQFIDSAQLDAVENIVKRHGLFVAEPAEQGG